MILFFQAMLFHPPLSSAASEVVLLDTTQSPMRNTMTPLKERIPATYETQNEIKMKQENKKD